MLTTTPLGSPVGPSGGPTPGSSPAPVPKPGMVCTTECIPGTTRYCDEPTYCRWGIQVCNKDQFWGVCTETTARPPGCSSNLYDQTCCVNAGACCEDLKTNLVDPNGHQIHPSLGQCTNIATTCQ
jgi:hypothetical protein